METEEQDEPDTVFVDYSFEEKYGRRRRYITVYKKKSKPLARFIGTDKYSVSGRVAWTFRHNEGSSLVRDLNNLPDEYSEYKPVRFRKLVNGSGAPFCWAVAMRENPEKLIEVGLAREAAKL